MSAGQVTIALLKAKDIAFHMALCFQLADLLADELKARQVQRSSTPYFLATGVAISVETMVVTATGSLGHGATGQGVCGRYNPAG